MLGPDASSEQKAKHQRFMEIENHLKKRIIGQDEAVTAVSQAIRKAKVGLKNPRRPVGSFVFVGQTGVGKTELAKALCEFLTGNETDLIRVDCSEYAMSHEYAKLIGAPPGYIGHNEGGYLTEAVKNKPNGVVVFDEVEKAHPQVFNILLQILDEGHITDAKGRRVNFKNTIIVLTSNIGSQEILNFDGEPAALTLKINNLLKGFFKPEFLNRIDNIITFSKLEKKQIKQIAQIQFSKLSKRLQAQGIQLEISDKALSYLAEKGYDPDFGARPLKRLIQEEIENPLAIKIIEGDLKAGETITVDRGKAGLTI